MRDCGSGCAHARRHKMAAVAQLEKPRPTKWRTLGGGALHRGGGARGTKRNTTPQKKITQKNHPNSPPVIPKMTILFHLNCRFIASCFSSRGRRARRFVRPPPIPLSSLY